MLWAELKYLRPVESNPNNLLFTLAIGIIISFYRLNLCKASGDSPRIYYLNRNPLTVSKVIIILKGVKHVSSATITLLILAAAAILFITELIPLAITAIGVSTMLFLTGVVSAKVAFSGLSNSTTILIAAMFPVGAALFETGVAAIIGKQITKVASSPKKLIVAIMAVAGGLSGFLSNTGTTAVLMPVVISIAATAGYSRSKLLMTLAYATGLGGIITLVGTPPNLVVYGVLKDAGLGTFGFFEFAKIGIPMLVVGTIYMTTLGYGLVPDRSKNLPTDDMFAAAGAEDASKQASSLHQMISVAVLVVTVIVMAIGDNIGIPMYVAAVIGSVVLVITKVMDEKQAYKSIDWTTVFLLAGMMPMADALDKSGAAKMIADVVIGIIGQDAGPTLLMIGLFILTAGLTQFMSNTAATTLLAPIGLAIASGMGADPRAILMAIAVSASSAFATPVGTPPNTIIYGVGGFKFMDYVKAGTPLILIMAVVCVFLIPMIWPFY
jgi:sodium-dependent dicarboxylate transporter 2/3/5